MKVRLNPRRRDSDRYALTPLAKALLGDPLETWYTLDKDAERKLEGAEAPVLEAVA